MICNNDCLNCNYDDCINDDLSIDDFIRQQAYDKDVITGNSYADKKKLSKEKQKEYYQRYYDKHKDEVKARNRAYYKSHKEKFIEYDRLYKKLHPIDPAVRHERYVRWRDKKRRLAEEAATI